MSMARERNKTRVVIGLEPAALDPLALRAAAELAHFAGAELAALFIEDLNLLRLGQLPFAAEICGASAVVRRFGAADLERAMKTQAERLRRMLAEAAQTLELEWSFNIARGAPLEVLVSSAGDIIVVPARRSRFGPAPEEVMRAALRRHPRQAHPVAVVWSRSPAAKRALAAAQALAREGGADLLVLVTAGNAAAQGRPASLDRTARVVTLPALDPEHVAQAIDDAAVLFWPGDHEPPSLREIDALTCALHCPLVLVR